MNITTTLTKVGDDLVQTVNARNLHETLGAKRDFSNWAKAQVKRARLVLGRDYITVEDLSSPKVVSSNLDGQNLSSPKKASSKSRRQVTIEYHLTLDAAKHIAMISHTEKGFEVREYFIQVEEDYQKLKLETNNKTIEGLQQQIKDLQSKPNPLDWLDPSNIRYLGGIGEPTTQRTYYAVLEALVLDVNEAANRYDISPEKLREWLATYKVPEGSLRTILGKARPELRELAWHNDRDNPIAAIKYDMYKAESARLEREKVAQRKLKSAATRKANKLARLSANCEAPKLTH